MNRRRFLQTTAITTLGIAFDPRLRVIAATNDDWIAESAKYALPDWFESHRAHVHTRLGAKENYLDVKVAAAVKEMGATVFTRHVRSGQDGPFWPTKHGAPHKLATQRNFVTEICRDGCDGRPAHVWLPFMTAARPAMLGTAGILAHGCIAAIDVNEKRFPDPELAPAFALANKVSPVLTGTKPHRRACGRLLESQAARV